MNDPQQENRERDLKIAENEAKRELTSDVRLTTWAIGLAGVIGFALLYYFWRR